MEVEELAKLAAELYCSDKLPDWFQSIRNSHLYFHYLTHDVIANPPSNKPFDSSFNFELMIKQCIYYGIKDLTGELVNEYPEVKRIRLNPENDSISLSPLSKLTTEKIYRIIY